MVARRILIALTGALLIAGVSFVLWSRSVWTPEEVTTLRGMRLGSLLPLPPDPSNKVANDPRAVLFGQRLFFDTRLSVDGTVACATCHAPERQFQDGTPLGQGVGTTNRRTVPLAGVAYSPWLFWDGRKDSACGPTPSARSRARSSTAVAAPSRPT